jgi:thiol-disulfide isomerase/thioredoxin
MALLAGCGLTAPSQKTSTPRERHGAVDRAPSEKRDPQSRQLHAVKSCERASGLVSRFRKVKLRGESPHLGSLSVPGFYNIIIIGAEWCIPCAAVFNEIPGWVETYPDVAFTYVDIVDEGESISALTSRNGITVLPYAFVSDPCGVGLMWITSDVGATGFLSDKISEQLRKEFGGTGTRSGEARDVQPPAAEVHPDPEEENPSGSYEPYPP